MFYMKMPWFKMYYQVIWPSKCFLDDFNNTKTVPLAYINGYNAHPPNVGYKEISHSMCTENQKIGACIKAILRWNEWK